MSTNMKEQYMNNTETKKAYQAPELKDYGKVGAVTKTSEGGFLDDGGGFPEYVSGI